MDTKKSDKIFKKIRKWKKRHGRGGAKTYTMPFTVFSAQFAGQNVDKNCLMKEYYALSGQEREELAESLCSDPVNARLNPVVNFGALSEQLRTEVENYLLDYSQLPRGWRPNMEEQFRKSVYWKGVTALCEPGDPVGIVAAQSIGEPSTQMTLNTFHFAGRGEMNVTLGIPRLREIFMHASVNIATPTAQARFLPGVSREAAENVKRVMDRLYLKQFLKSARIYETMKCQGGSICVEYVIEIHVLKSKKRDSETRHIKNAEVIARMERRLFKSITMVLKRQVDKSHQEKKAGVKKALKSFDIGLLSRNNRPGDGSDPDAPEQEFDADAADDSRFQKQDDETGYVGETEEKLQEDLSDEESDSDKELDIDIEFKKETLDEHSNEAPAEKPCVNNIPDRGLDAERIAAVLRQNPFATNYSYDARKSSWCRLTLELTGLGTLDVAPVVVDEIEKFVVQETPNIKRCILREEGDLLILQTDGVNLEGFYSRAHLLDINTITCNDIHTIASTYGIEAASRALVKEIKMVFGAYGIEVDHRHLSLVADYMTHTGSFMPFNRMYMRSSSSPFQKMSFETTTVFLKDAVCFGENEDLQSPSSRIVVGSVPKVGTGCFDLMVDVKKS